MWDNDEEILGEEEQLVRSVAGNAYAPEDWVFCVQCDSVFRVQDLIEGDEGGDSYPKCGAGGLDQDIFSIGSDLASDEIREAYKREREEREWDEYGEEEESAYDENWLFEGRDE